MNRSLLIALGAFLAGIGVHWFVGALQPRPSPDRSGSAAAPRPPSGAEAGEAALDAALVDIRMSLGRIEERLAGLEAAREDRRQPVGEEVAAGAGEQVAELTGLVRTLEEELRAQRAAADSDESRKKRLERLRAENPETDWPAVYEVIADWGVDEEATARRLKLLSDETLLERFGSPTEMWGNAQGVHWVYGDGYDEAAKEYATELYLLVVDGTVTTAGVKH